MLRKIVTRGDPVLGKRCHAVTRFDRRLWDLLDDLRETLAEAHGMGLAAPQVGILRRAVVVVSDPSTGDMIELVNPRILVQEGEEEDWEGCLSVPGLWGRVKRPLLVRLEAQDRRGQFFEVEGEGVVARCFCHELEHLDGHLYTEHCSRLYTTEELDAMEKAEEEREAGEARDAQNPDDTEPAPEPEQEEDQIS